MKQIKKSRCLTDIVSLCMCLLLGFILCPGVLQAAELPLPVNQQGIHYYCPPTEPVSGDGTNPSLMKPLSVGPVAIGGDVVNISMGTAVFADYVDLYMIFYMPSLDENLYLLDGVGTFHLFDTAGDLQSQMVPMLESVKFESMSIIGDIPVSALPAGMYYLGLVATPTGVKSLSEYYFWETSFLITPSYVSVSPFCIDFGNAEAGKEINVKISNPGNATGDAFEIYNITGTDDYRVEDVNKCSASTLWPGDSCDVTVVFDPKVDGSIVGSISMDIRREASSESASSPDSTEAVNLSSSNSPEVFNLSIMSTGVKQSCASPQITPPLNHNFSSSGGSGSINVTAGSGCPWSASTTDQWISITYGSSGTGNGVVSYTVSSNTATVSRTGHIKIGSQSYDVIQAGATTGSCNAIEIALGLCSGGGGGTCSYKIAASNKAFGSSGGTGSISVTTGTGCPWTIKSNKGWPTFTSASGTGNGTVNYSVPASNAADSATIYVSQAAGTQLVITQNGGAVGGGSVCSYGITAIGNTIFGPSGGTGSLSVTSGAGCPWTIKSNKGWPTFTSASGTGNGTVNYSVPASNMTDTATIYVSQAAGTQLVISQNGIDCTYSLDATTTDFGSQGGGGSLTVTTASGCSWQLQSDSSWIKFPSVKSGTGTATVSYSVSSLATTGLRTGHISLNSANSIAISQSGPCTFTLSSTDTQPFASAGGTGTINLNVSGTGCNWNAVSSAPSWIILNNSSGTGSALTYNVSVNGDSNAGRGGKITVGDQTYIVMQAAAPPVVSPGPPPSCVVYLPETAKSFEATGGTGSFQFGTTGCGSFTVTAPSWITITSGANVPNDGIFTVKYTVSANTQLTTMQGSIIIKDKSYTVTQAGASALNYTNFVLNSHNNFYSLPAAPRSTIAKFFKFTIPAEGCNLYGYPQIILAGLVPNAGNNNMLLSDTDFGTQANALEIYNHFYRTETGGYNYNVKGNNIVYPTGSSSHYWYYFTTSGGDEEFFLNIGAGDDKAIPNKTYYLAVVNDSDNRYTDWRLEVYCY